ncbi:MAG: hypothetical protein M3N54_04870, partial [Acidobacteriota bacterium]|nr:hypothetical protein [Acidobacteriota bacterium]
MLRKRAALIDSTLICLLTALLIGPLFRLKYLDNWGSIESTFIADSRMLINNFPHPGWQPLWYCGTRFDYIYPPALRYGTALIAWGAHMTTARAYHLYTAVLYVLGILAVYWLVRLGSGSRKGGLLASAATALLSPSFLFLTDIRHDSGWWVPQRLHVLMSYGEGPHISALCVLTAALAMCFTVLRKWSPARFAAAAGLCAFAVSNNFYGATALAVFFPFVVWSVWLGRRDGRVLLRAAGIAAFAWGLCAFWLTPSYVGITLVNMQWVAQPGNRWSVLVAGVVCALFGAVSWRVGNRRPEREWTIFTAGAALFLSLNVIGLAYFGFRIYGEPIRLIPELDLALILLAVEALRYTWQRPRLRIAVALMTVAAFSPSFRYLRHVWTPFPKAQAFESSYEYETSRWVNDHLHGARVLPSGSLRFWFDAWFDNSQPDGGSMQGMLNQILPAATWQIIHGPRTELATLWLQALGTDAVIAPAKNSRDVYRDYEHAEKFRGVLTALHDDGHGTVIYGVPRVHPGIGRVV